MLRLLLIASGLFFAPPSVTPMPVPPKASSSIVDSVTVVGGAKSGCEVRRRSDGSVQDVATWVSGKRHGVYREYFAEGQCAVEGQYEQGERSGIWRQWSSCGELVWETPYVNGKKHGVRHQWINDCDPKTSQYIAETVTFEDNLKQGPSRSWWNTGQLSAEGDYDHDEKHGTWKTYYSDGSPMKTIVYDHGKKVSQVDHRP